MKTISAYLLTLLLFVTMASAQSADEKDVATAVESLRKAMVDGAKAKLENLVAAELSYGHSSGKIEDKAAFVEALVSGKTDFNSIELSSQSIRIAGNDAIVRHIFKGELLTDGKTSAINISVLMVWQKQKAGWKLLARQAVKV